MAAQAKRTSSTNKQPVSRRIAKRLSQSTDPIFAAMDGLKEARQACVVAYKEAEKLMKGDGTKHPYKKADHADNAAIAAYRKMMATRPETIDGLMARLEYLNELHRAGELIGFYNDNDGERLFSHLAKDVAYLKAKQTQPEKPATDAERAALQFEPVHINMDFIDDTWLSNLKKTTWAATKLVSLDRAGLTKAMSRMDNDGIVGNAMEGISVSKSTLDALVDLFEAALTRSFLVLGAMGYSPDNPPK